MKEETKEKVVKIAGTTAIVVGVGVVGFGIGRVVGVVDCYNLYTKKIVEAATKIGKLDVWEEIFAVTFRKGC